MKKKTFSLSVFVLTIILGGCTQKPTDNPQITVSELEQHVRYLASTKLQGRFPGTAGDSLAANYIQTAFSKGNFQLLEQQGLQPFPIHRTPKLKLTKQLTINGQHIPDTLMLKLLKISSAGEITGNVYYAGMAPKVNFTALKPKLTDNIWLALTLPRQANTVSENHIRSIALNAKNAGFAAVLLLAQDNHTADKLNSIEGGDAGIHISVTMPETTRYLHQQFQISDLSETKKINNTTLNLAAERKEQISYTHNIVAALIADTTKPFVVIGAHYDHLGMGGLHSGSRRPDTTAIHPGADDNASGIAAMLEIADYLAAKRDSLQKNILFIAFAAEEMGLLGSKYFLQNPSINKEKIAVMLNLDMLGRMKEDNSLQIGGVGTFDYAADLLNRCNTDSFKLGISNEGYGPSDHASFYSASIPVLFFSTGAHLDYHTPNDTAGALQYNKMTKATRYIARIASHIGQSDSLYTFRQAGPTNPQANRHARRHKISLGIMPDFSGVVKEGLRADIVIKGKPAHTAGMKNGDIIIALNGKPVKDIYEYMTLLNDLKAGETVIVEVLRKKEKKILLVQL